MNVRNYSHIDTAEIVNVNGSQYAVAEDDDHYITILPGEVVGPDEPHGEDEPYFWAFEQPDVGYVQIPTSQLLEALDHAIKP